MITGHFFCLQKVPNIECNLTDLLFMNVTFCMILMTGETTSLKFKSKETKACNYL